MATVTDTVLVILFFALFVSIFFSQLFLKPILAICLTPSSDLTRIRANVGGLLGDAGPGKDIQTIVRSGTILPRRGQDCARRYLVTLQAPGGDVERRYVDVAVRLFGSGGLTVHQNHYRPGTELSRIADGTVGSPSAR